MQGYLAAVQRFKTKSAVSKFAQILFERHYNLLLISITVFLDVTPSGLVGRHISTKFRGSYHNPFLPYPVNFIPLTSDFSPTR
jgi:hypothetical protein